MSTKPEYPRFEEHFADLNKFTFRLVDLYHEKKIDSWEHLENQVSAFFTPARMEQIEADLPGWKKMASYSGGVTLVHVTCVFLGMYMLPEFHSLSSDQQNIMKWVVLLHDIDKFHIRGKKDTMHAFRSGVVAAKLLPGLGFPTTDKYPDQIRPWSELTRQAFLSNGDDATPTPDNGKLPEILTGIEELFGENTSAALIIKTVLLHISLHVDDRYPTPAPLTKEEIRRYIDPALFPLLRVMMLSDSEGWSLFEPETRERQRKDTLAAFGEVERLIASSV